MSGLELFGYETYAKSAERHVTAGKKPTTIRFFLNDPDTAESLDGKTVSVGKKVRLATILNETGGPQLFGMRHKIYHRVGAGAWETIVDKVVDTVWELYTIAEAGLHTFYAEFPGDAMYEGCKKLGKAFAR